MVVEDLAAVVVVVEDLAAVVVVVEDFDAAVEVQELADYVLEEAVDNSFGYYLYRLSSNHNFFKLNYFFCFVKNQAVEL